MATTTYECRNPTCPTILASLRDPVMDSLDELLEAVQELAFAEQAVAKIAQRDEWASAGTVRSAVHKVSDLERTRTQDALLVAARRVTGFVEDAERERYEVRYDPGRSYGDPYNCYPAELIDDPICPECREEAHQEGIGD